MRLATSMASALASPLVERFARERALATLAGCQLVEEAVGQGLARAGRTHGLVSPCISETRVKPSPV
jgi:hypothetical protein